MLFYPEALRVAFCFLFWFKFRKSIAVTMSSLVSLTSYFLTSFESPINYDKNDCFFYFTLAKLLFIEGFDPPILPWLLDVFNSMARFLVTGERS